MVRLTTFNNPFNPFHEYADWHSYDCLNLGLGSAEYLSRIAHTSEQLSDYENEEEIERAIDEIIRLDPFFIYRKCDESETVEETRRIYEDFMKSSEKEEG